MTVNCSLGATLRYDPGVQLHAPFSSLVAVIFFVLFLPLMSVAHQHGLPRKIRAQWSKVVGGRGPEAEPSVVGADGSGFEMSFRSLVTTNMDRRLTEARNTWSESWFRGEVSMGLEPLLDDDEEQYKWEKAPEFVLDDDYGVVFTHAVRPGCRWEKNSQCWQPSPALRERGIELEASTLNWLERLFSVRAGSNIDKFAAWLLPDLDVDLAQRRSNLYRPLYYKSRDLRWCPGALHKTYRNVLSKPNFDEPASETSEQTSHNRALLSYLPELRAMEQLYSVGFWTSFIMMILMFPLMIDSLFQDNATRYFVDQGVAMEWHAYLLWRTSWINADTQSGAVAWRDGFGRVILTVRMFMFGAVLVWACFRHSAHDVMIDHPIGLQDFSVELRDLPTDVTEEEIISAFEAEDPELQVAKVIFIESSFADDDQELTKFHSVALVSFHTIAMRDQVLMAHHSPNFFGITHNSSYRRSCKTGINIRPQEDRADHTARVLPAVAPCELIYENYAWQRTKALNTLSQHGMLVMVCCFLVGTYLLLYCLYCSEFGVNPFNPGDISNSRKNSSVNASLVYQACAVLVALCMPVILEKIVMRFNTRTKYSAVVSRVIVWSTLVGIFYLPAQVMAASSTVFKNLCASDELAIGSLSGVAVWLYFIIFPGVVLVKPPAIKLFKTLSMWFMSKCSSREATQEDLDAAFRLPAFDSIEHLYDLLYLCGIGRIILGFTPLAMVSTAAALWTTKLAVQYHLRYQSSAAKYACGSPAQHVTAVFMFLFVNTLITVKRSGLFTDHTHAGDQAKTQILFGATPETLFQGTKDALNYWPMLSWSTDELLVVISIPELLLLIIARYSYGWVYFLALKKDLPRRRLKTIGATYGEFARKCENYDKEEFTSTRAMRTAEELDAAWEESSFLISDPEQDSDRKPLPKLDRDSPKRSKPRGALI
eukprot:TRINITY_DN11654_c0_g1_i4.p1 TRINITY_DN11654_c0_g1~~TRINITY_DN11654_c0_g1_i4.p1  ORF type:complete len:936 (-),score=191.35 TRINITY_DN11654_c0_g1_i4:271-3078(-)